MLGSHLKNIFGKSAVYENALKECPEPELLASFIEDKLSINKQEAIEKHLVVCDECLSKVIVCSPIEESECKDTVGVLSDILVRFTAQASEVIAYVNDIFTLPVPALGTIRGAEKEAQHIARFSRSFDRIKAEWEIKKIVGDGCEIKLSLTKDNQPLDNIRASLIYDGNEQESHLTVDGEALFETCGFDSYTIVMKKGATLIGELKIEIRDENLNT